MAVTLKEDFAKEQKQVPKKKKNEELNTGEPFQDGQLRIFTAQLPAGDDRSYCVILAECASPTHHVLVGLFTCAPEEGFYEYAVHRRAFNIVLETMSTREE